LNIPRLKIFGDVNEALLRLHPNEDKVTGAAGFSEIAASL
jgi:hypothetical protein